MDLEREWFYDLEPSAVSYQDEKLSSIMQLVFEQVSATVDMNKLVATLASISDQKLFTNVNLALYFRALVAFMRKLKLEQLCDDLVDLDRFVSELIARLHQNSIEPLTAYFLIDALFGLTSNAGPRDPALLGKLIDSIEYEPRFECLYDLVLGKFDRPTRVEHFWRLFEHYRITTSSQPPVVLKKLLALFYMMQIGDDFADACVPNDPDQLLLIDYMVNDLLLKNISNLDVSVRALVARGLGCVASISVDLAKTFSHLFTQV